MSQENVEIVQGLFDAMSRGDVEAVLRFVRSDGEWVNPDNAMEPGTRRGLSGVRIALMAFQDAFAEVSFDSKMVDLDDRVLVTGTFSGVGRTSGAGFASQPFGVVMTLVEGKVLRYQWYLSPAEALQAVGLSE